MVLEETVFLLDVDTALLGNDRIASVTSLFINHWDIDVQAWAPAALRYRPGIDIAKRTTYRAYRELLTTEASAEPQP